MIGIEYVKYPPSSIDYIKNKKLNAHLRSIPILIDEIKDKKFVNLKNQSENLVKIKTLH